MTAVLLYHVRQFVRQKIFSLFRARRILAFAENQVRSGGKCQSID
jgi:hypothetical protein